MVAHLPGEHRYYRSEEHRYWLTTDRMHRRIHGGFPHTDSDGSLPETAK